MTGTKKYFQPYDMILNAIHDLAEMQKGKTLLCDSARGLIRIKVMIYGAEWEYRFTVTGIGGSRSGVAIELCGDGKNVERLIKHEFALLDYALTDRTEIEIAEIENFSRNTDKNDGDIEK